MTSISKNVYIEILADIVHEYYNPYHNTIKMKPVDINSSTYIDFGTKNKDKNPEFKVGDYARVSKYKNIFAKSNLPNCSDDIFVIKKVKNSVPWT